MSHPTRGTGAGRGAPKGNATGRGGSKASTPIPGARAASAPTIPPQQIASNSNLEIADTSHDDLYADPSGSAQPSNIPLPQGSPTAEDVARDKGKGREVETATPHSAGLSANTINSATLPAILKGREDSQSGVLQLDFQLKQIELELKKKRDLKKHFDNQIYDYQALRPGEYEKHMASLLGDNWRQLVPSVPPPRDDSRTIIHDLSMRAQPGNESPGSSSSRTSRNSRKSRGRSLPRSAEWRSPSPAKNPTTGHDITFDDLDVLQAAADNTDYRNEVDHPDENLMMAILRMNKSDWVDSKSYQELARLSFKVDSDIADTPDLRQKLFDISCIVVHPNAKTMSYENRRELLKDAYLTGTAYAKIASEQLKQRNSQLRVPHSRNDSPQSQSSRSRRNTREVKTSTPNRAIGNDRLTEEPLTSAIRARESTNTAREETAGSLRYFPRFASVNPQLPSIKIEGDHHQYLPDPHAGIAAYPQSRPSIDRRGVLPSSMGPNIPGVRSSSTGPQTGIINAPHAISQVPYVPPTNNERFSITPMIRSAPAGQGGYTHPGQRGYIKTDIQYNHPSDSANALVDGMDPPQGDKPAPMLDAPFWDATDPSLPKIVQIIRRAWNTNRLQIPTKSALATVGIKLEAGKSYSGEDDPERFEAMLVNMIALLESYNLMGPHSMDEQIRIYATKLSGDAEEFYRKELMPQKGYGTIFTLESVALSLYNRFITPTGLMKASVEFNSLRQGADSVLKFYGKLTQAAKSMSEPPAEITIRHRFMVGIDPAIRNAMALIGMNEYHSDSKQLLEAATRIDESRRMIPQSRPSTSQS
ncbi:hypothetical protein SISSUDRAFT_1065647 [Sistotremastrum suecicum HHB10207 ss-3]|uniref:Uncharacterized protein n=1 Tax=Sistotremastrum suecicum HHB10207 ss-3 TaxID=1314776 RepID=A0A165Z7G9_9AGAM|nr:hypothetical protein SISSUDRAFT_1065647 [Sistotremastrum suecicum HHB10207 ss-3]